MMSNLVFNHTAYVPILRRRPAEMDALKNLLNEDFKQTIPLFEMVEHLLSEKKQQKLNGNKNNFYLYDVVKSLAACCGDKPYFIDFANTADIFNQFKGKHVIESYFDLLRHHFLTAIPVTGLNRPDSFQSAISKVLQSENIGICLRLSQRDIRDPLLVPRIQLLLKRLHLEPELIDILVDLKIVDMTSPSIEEICNRLPMLKKWRNFIVASGAFPDNLSEFDKNGEYEVPRKDLKHWIDGFTNRSRISRIPTYSDYTIQSPKVPQKMDFIPNVSASIRYTSNEHWVIMRGEGLRNVGGAKFDQYWGQANSLMFRDEYSGEDFSFGDQYIAKIGNQSQNTGNPNTWLKAGINRHITFTVRQLSQITSTSKANDFEVIQRTQRSPLQRIWNQSRLVLPNSSDQGYLFPPTE